VNYGISITRPSPTHEEAMKRYREELERCKDMDPPLTVEEQKHILDACLTGGCIILRCTFADSSSAAEEKE
jgi:hypothetical protein